MDHKKLYDNIIIRARSRTIISDYCERHHIIPKYMGGPDSEDNLVVLTAREHFICHYLLWKMNPNCKKALYSFHMMRLNKTGDRYFNSRLYSNARREYLARFTGENNPMYGRKHTPETRAKLSLARRTRTTTQETKDKLSKAFLGSNNHRYGVTGPNNPITGRKYSEEHRRKIGESYRNNRA